MSENDEHNNLTDAADLALARAIRDLPRELPLQRDLWPGIERKIAAHPRRRRGGWGRTWQPYGVAASLLVASAALVLSIMRTDVFSPRVVSFDRSMDNMQAEYIQVRNPLMQKFNETNRNLDPATRDDLYRNFEIMEQARRQIEQQVRAHPEDRRLLELLMKVNQQELDLLRQDYTQPTHSM